MFQLTNQLIDTKLFTQSLQDHSAGAHVTFEGWVRNQNDGKKVRSLEYEACEDLCLKESQKIIDEAKNKFEIIDISCVHRTGKLEIGDIAVWVGVIATHRQDAFLACHYIIDEIKTRLPIWKKEIYIDGSTSWVNCEKHIEHTKVELDQENYYSRQIILPEIGQVGQKKLANSRVLIIGAGGLGSAAAIYLAGAGIGTIGICDFDLIDASNLHRQINFNANSIGLSKVEITKDRLKELNPFINVITHHETITANTNSDLFDNYDLILDCTDNLESKLAINYLAISKQKVIIQASVYQWEGQIQRWELSGGGQCLSCLWSKDSLNAQSKMCTQAGILGSVVGVLGTLQATEAIKYLLNIPSPLKDNVMLFNLITLETQMIKTTRNADCPSCSSTAHKHTKLDPSAYEVQITNLEELDSFALIDVLSLLQFEDQLDPKVEYLVCCPHGISSLSQVVRLRESGWTNLYSLKGGTEGNKVLREWLTAQEATI